MTYLREVTENGLRARLELQLDDVLPADYAGAYDP